MAITRTQIARQLYKDGKRVGLFKGAQADTRSGQAMSPGTSVAGGTRSGPEGDREAERFSRRARTNIELDRQQTKDRDDRGGESFIDQVKKFPNIMREIGLKNSLNYNLGLNKTRGFPIGIQVMNAFNPGDLTAQDYTDIANDPGLDQLGMSGKDLTAVRDKINALDKAETTGISQSEFEKAFYGPDGKPEPDDRDGGGQQILPPVLAQAPRTTEQEEELSELGQLLANMSGQRYAFMADGGRIGLKGGGADYMKSDADKEFEAFKKMYMQDSMKRGEKEIKDIYEREKKKLLEKRYGVAVANGGIMSPNLVGGMMDGGIDEMGRQMYGLGKLVKKATRAVKKIAKSPIGKAALAYGLTFGIPGVQSGFFSKGLMGTQKGLGFKKFLGDTLFGKMKYAGPVEKGFGVKTGGLFNSPLALISGASALAGLMTKQDEEDDQINLEEVRGPRLDIAGIRTKPYEAMGQAYGFYAEGGDVKEPVAKKTLPLLDMDGKEKDYRETGGFVDIGRMEKADDVPARLSKNEFVFTADAVRNAGDGDIDKGAEVMYNMMKNLEAGGDVSEESQGLEGARKMFQTSQRLEEVL